MDAEGFWYISRGDGKIVEEKSAENMKRTWVKYGKHRNWLDAEQGEGEVFLRNATQIKNIWVPYGA